MVRGLVELKDWWWRKFEALMNAHALEIDLSGPSTRSPIFYPSLSVPALVLFGRPGVQRHPVLPERNSK